jgi:hypothetical protein
MPTKPFTVEKMIEHIKRLLSEYPDGQIPYEECIIPSHDFFLDFCERLVALEKMVEGG